MQSADPLAQLHDILLPEPIGWWPLAWGWWLLLALIILGTGTAVYLYRRKFRRQAYRRQAISLLQEIFEQYRAEGDSAILLQQLSVLLRRTALTAQPTRFPVDIMGAAWLQWLDDYCPETRRGFSEGPGQSLLQGPYQANPVIDGEALYSLARTWIEKHRDLWQKQPALQPAAPEPKEIKSHA